MQHDLQYQKLFGILTSRFSEANVGLLCNQTAFSWTDKKYLASVLDSAANLVKIFVPEHGFFAELQDQEEVDLLHNYDFLNIQAEIISIYGKEGSELINFASQMTDLDLLIIDIQDVGVRYFTYITTIARIFQVLKNRNVSILVIDHSNPAGRQVEGTLLSENYTSLIGWPGLPHRYGLTIGELCLFLKDQLNGIFNLEIIKTENKVIDPGYPYPSPNIPFPVTIRIYAGQCLWEGTNVSEGRGTTRPFEIFGAPFFNELLSNWTEEWNNKNPEAILRPLIFIPTFHKYQDQVCSGFQLHPVLGNFHSLWYSLKLIRAIKAVLKEFRWREGPYEVGSDKTAIELLAGDEVLLNYLNGKEKDETITERLHEEERKWIEQSSQYVLYGDKLRFTNLNKLI